MSNEEWKIQNEMKATAEKRTCRDNSNNNKMSFASNPSW